MYGNRGCLHDAHGKIVRRFQVKRWIACRLEFKDRRRVAKLQPGRYTELFFLDEATAFAAGHRPCAECRRDDYNRFMQIVGESRALPTSTSDCMPNGWRPTAPRGSAHCPTRRSCCGTVEPWLVLGDELLRWSPAGYTERVARPSNGAATVVTPPSLLDVLRRGFTGVVPLLHPSARCR